MVCLSAALVAAVSIPVLAQELPREGPVPTTALIAAQSKNGATLNAAALKLEVNGHSEAITSVTPVGTQSPQIAILIDDGLRGSFNLQMKEMEQFITGLPPSAQVLVGYMQNGTVRSATGQFSTNREAIVQQLRMPISTPGISASPYFCLSDFVKRWPSSQPGPRFVLMITNGVDPYNGRPDLMNQDSPYVEAAQNDAQRAGVAVYSIYYTEAGFRGGRGSFSGQSYLDQVGEATGGMLFNQGSITPVSLAPYFAQFQRAIAESYVIGFMANAKGEQGNTLTHIRLKTSQPDMKLRAPDGVHPGLDESTIAAR
jgi:hypothetical protein